MVYNHTDSIASAMALPILLVYPFTSVASSTSGFVFVFLSGIQGEWFGGSTPRREQPKG